MDDPLVLLLQQTPGRIEPSPNRSKLNYSSFQTSGELDSSWSTPVKHPTVTPRTPLQLPAPRTSLLSPTPSTPVSASSPAVGLESAAPPTPSTPSICSSLNVDLDSSAPSPASESTLPHTLSSSTPLRVSLPVSSSQSVEEPPGVPLITTVSQSDLPPDTKGNSVPSCYYYR